MKLVYDLLTYRTGKFTVRVGLYLGSWMIGGYVDEDSSGFEIGPLGIDWESNTPAEFSNRSLWSWRIYRLAIQPLRLDIRFDLDLNIWRIGYLMSAPCDHGLYLGPFNLQIEYTARRSGL